MEKENCYLEIWASKLTQAEEKMELVSKALKKGVGKGNSPYLLIEIEDTFFGFVTETGYFLASGEVRDEVDKTCHDLMVEGVG